MLAAEYDIDESTKKDINMICPACKMEIAEDAVFCQYCGYRTDGQESPETPRERFLAAATSTSNISDDDEEERELWQGSYSKLAMIGSWVAASVFSVAALITAVAAGFSGGSWGIALGLILLVWVVLILRLLYLQLSRHYYLSNQRFVHEEGLLWREINRVEAIDIDDVTFVQGPVERFLGVGTVKIISSDQSHPVIELPGIENVRAVSSLIDETRRQERRKRGLHIESI